MGWFRKRERIAPAMFGPTQTPYSIQLERTMEVATVKGSRRARRDLRRMHKGGDATIKAMVDMVWSTPEIRAAMVGLARPKVRVVGRHTVNGQNVGGSMNTFAKRGPVLTIQRNQATPTMILHELAHYAVDARAGFYAGHEQAWHATYANFVNALYPSRKTAWYGQAIAKALT